LKSTPEISSSEFYFFQAEQVVDVAEEMGMTEQFRRKARRDAIASACFGSLPSVMIQDSAVIILYAGILGAGDMLSLITTSVFGVMYCLMLIPFAYFSDRSGFKNTIIRSNLIGFATVILLSCSPFFGGGAKSVMMIAILVFGICMTAYAAAWFPLLDEFLREKERGNFFGMLRFSWQLTSVVFFFCCGLIIGKTPPVWILQIIIAVTAFGLLGRVFYVLRLPSDNYKEKKHLNFSASLGEALGNKPLAGFSVYLAFLYLAAGATLPLTFLYLKKYLLVPDNIVVIISSLALGGSIVGFLCAGRIIMKLGIKRVLLGVHFSFALVNFVLFFLSSTSGWCLVVITALLAFYGFFMACSSVAVSSEMMALASPENKAMAMAFCGSMYSAGMGGSRLLSSLVIGSGVLSPEWYIGSLKFSHYQTMFLGYGLAIMFVCTLLVVVPAVFPKGTYRYMPH
jgi:MFS family permease